ncbi:MAG: ferritin [candidate division KSB1 bacterium]|nr:ferritin [candidate division KSB1 bacterium]
MISEKMSKALNEQINKELYSAYYYLSMATFLDHQNLEGMANFLKHQAQEEVGHAMKIYNYLNEQGVRVTLEAIAKPRTDFSSAQQIFELGLEHEKTVTKSIHDLMTLALQENDYASKAFLDWFVSEQVEEEATFDGIVSKFKMSGGQGHALLMLDAQLGQRS